MSLGAFVYGDVAVVGGNDCSAEGSECRVFIVGVVVVAVERDASQSFSPSWEIDKCSVVRGCWSHATSLHATLVQPTGGSVVYVCVCAL